MRLLLLTLGITLLSCEEDYKYFYSDQIELRQLVKETTTDKYSHGSFFLIGGNYANGETQTTTIKVFGKVDGLYRFIEMDMEDIRIKIDNNLTKPNIIIRYWWHKKVSIDNVLNNHDYYGYNVIYIINCPEKFLPEKLLPIEL